ncbi:concanavalin A-like lectin/glucanase domain-containing protein [Mycena rosella]|uniref:endo-1,4-beta-xylanase n=1 Tax=Mycena rosella TaxID=1033263 RepID=A0AAD7F601_MYCRO|nr:concanavalin A-like lectin/glucanase domain-containing protein [Mycena rosella]
MSLTTSSVCAASTNSSGLIFGYYYIVTAEDGGAVQYTNNDDGEYTLEWTNNSGSFVAGAGYNPGSAQTIRFGSFEVAGSSYLSIYGWTTNPLVEYHILEQNYGGNDPPVGLTWKGNLTSDSSVYDIYETEIYWSIRQDLRSDGLVTTGNHFSAWAAVGMPLDTFNYQIVAAEGFASSVNGSLTNAVESPPAGPCAPEYGQCGGQGFTGPNCCVSNTTCIVDNAFFSTCVTNL